QARWSFWRIISTGTLPKMMSAQRTSSGAGVSAKRNCAQGAAARSRARWASVSGRAARILSAFMGTSFGAGAGFPLQFTEDAAAVFLPIQPVFGRKRQAALVAVLFAELALQVLHPVLRPQRAADCVEPHGVLHRGDGKG